MTFKDWLFILKTAKRAKNIKTIFKLIDIFNLSAYEYELILNLNKKLK